MTSSVHLRSMRSSFPMNRKGELLMKKFPDGSQELSSKIYHGNNITSGNAKGIQRSRPRISRQDNQMV